MRVQNNRLLLELETAMREINQQVINPKIHDVTPDSLKPIMFMVAQSRAAYLGALFELASSMDETTAPKPEQVKKLKLLRLTYEELVSGVQALETAIDRGYLDIGS